MTVAKPEVRKAKSKNPDSRNKLLERQPGTVVKRVSRKQSRGRKR